MSTVSVQTVVVSYEAHYPIYAVWWYDVSDPLAVSLHLHDEVSVAAWSFSRQLLSAALDRSSRTLRHGEGDVSLLVVGDRFVIELTNDQGRTEFHCNIHDARSFLQRTNVMCPPCAGAQSVDHDFCLECSMVNNSIEELL